MSGIFISGLGAVSPAGWGSAALFRALDGGALPAPQDLARPGWTRPLSVLRVPPPNPRPPWAAHARMRRAPVISQFALGAAVEALGLPAAGALGIVFCTLCGCVNYSRRFYDEVLREPAVASPLLFPETVFNAPASHLSAVLGSSAVNYTLVGDAGVFLQGLVLAADWLAAGRVECCLVVAAEEVDWISADALRHFRKSAPLAEGAGAVLLTRERLVGSSAELECVTNPEPFVADDLAAGLASGAGVPACLSPPGVPPGEPGFGQRDAGRTEAAGTAAPLGHGGYGRAAAIRRVAAALPAEPTTIGDLTRLGEGFAASGAWQVLAAIRAAQAGRLPRATVLVPGAFQEAIGASFTLLPFTTP